MTGPAVSVSSYLRDHLGTLCDSVSLHPQPHHLYFTYTNSQHLQGSERNNYLRPSILPRSLLSRLLAQCRLSNLQLVHPQRTRLPNRLLQRLRRRRSHVPRCPASSALSQSQRRPRNSRLAMAFYRLGCYHHRSGNCGLLHHP